MYVSPSNLNNARTVYRQTQISKFSYQEKPTSVCLVYILSLTWGTTLTILVSIPTMLVQTVTENQLMMECRPQETGELA